MAESLRGGLSLSLCGFGFWSHDIGGFEGLPDPAVYKRWVAFGLLSSHSRLHGSTSYRVPWNYNDEACDVLRFFTKLKCRLMPYLYGAAVEAHREGKPMMRAMLLEFPGDPACAYLDRQYCLGGSLLVAPVLSKAGEVTYYLPAGSWTHLLTGEVRSGGHWFREQHGFLSMPLWVRPGTVLPMGARDNRPDYDFADGVTFRVYQLEEHAEAACTVPSMTGDVALRCVVRRSGRQIAATMEGPSGGHWRLRLAGVREVTPIDGCTTITDPLGVIVCPAAGATAVSVNLPDDPSRQVSPP
jgi:alpha-D-xyloside xylohydrolase